MVTGWTDGGSGFHIAIMRFTTGGVLDSAWGGSGVVTTSVAFNERIYAAVLQPDQRLVVAGGLNNGTNFVMARYLNDANTVTTTATAVTNDLPDPSPVGVSVPIEVSVTANSGGASPTGTVAVSDGAGNGCSASILEAGCSFVVTAAGRFAITAVYPSDGTYAPSLAAADEELVVQGSPVVEVPTLGEIGLALFALMLAVAALPVLRRAQG